MKLDPNFFWTDRENPQIPYGDGKTRSKSYTSLTPTLTNTGVMAISNWISPETSCSITGMVTPDMHIETTNSAYNQTGIEPLVYNTARQYKGKDTTTLTIRLAETERYAEGIITLTITSINAEHLTREINLTINKTPW